MSYTAIVHRVFYAASIKNTACNSEFFSPYNKIPIKYIIIGFDSVDLFQMKGCTMKNWNLVADSQIVCYCRQINKGTIVEAIKNGCSTLAQIQDETQACTGNQCAELNPSGNCCSGDLLELLELHRDRTTDQEQCGCCCC
jgi:NAD(P)H-nitrite reductase large subunit